MLAEVGERELAYRGAVGRCGCRREAPRPSDEFRSRDLHRIGLEVVHHHEEQVPLRVDPADDEATEGQAPPPPNPPNPAVRSVTSKTSDDTANPIGGGGTRVVAEMISEPREIPNSKTPPTPITRSEPG